MQAEGGVDFTHVFLGFGANPRAFHEDQLVLDETVGQLDHLGFAADAGINRARETKRRVGGIFVGRCQCQIQSDARAEENQEKGYPPAAGDDLEVPPEVNGDIDPVHQGSSLVGWR